MQPISKEKKPKLISKIAPEKQKRCDMDEGSSIRRDLKDLVDKVKDKEPSHELEKFVECFRQGSRE